MKFLSNQYLLFGGRVALIVLTYTALVVSLLPVIGWWGGVMATLLWGAMFFVWRNSELRSKLYHHLTKICIYAFISGFLFHGGCRIYSSWRLAILEDECTEVKERVLTFNE